jgi:EAL domain-containing protein (putative c-di-GMP-specific phosphodiesterase class I)
MGHSLNRRVAAEGVETEGQLSILKENGCDEIQGYYVCPPKTAAALTTFLRKNDGDKTELRRRCTALAD